MTHFKIGDTPVEAAQFRATEPGDSMTFSDIPQWLTDAFRSKKIMRVNGDRINGGDWDFLLLSTGEGDHYIAPDFWLVRLEDGRIYGCEPGLFHTIAQEVGDDASS